MRSLVIGGDGLIGKALTQILRKRGDVVTATTRRSCRGEGLLHLDLGDSDSVSLPQVEVAVFCAAITSFERCRENEALARRTNVTDTLAVARRLVDAGAHVVLLSTAAVFDFQTPQVPAEKAFNPSSAIGKIKAEAEVAFAEFGGLVTTLRLTKILVPETALFTNWMASLWQHQRIVAFTDHQIAPLPLDRVTADIVTLMDKRPPGTFQLSGARDLSYFEAARFLARRMRVKEAYVHSAEAIQSGIPPGEICRFASLDGSRLAALTGRKMPEPYDVLEAVYGQVIDARYGRHVVEAART